MSLDRLLDLEWVTAAAWFTGIGDAEIGAWVRRLSPGSGIEIAGEQSPLQAALGFVLAQLDPVWLVLGATICYGTLVREVGLAVARRWLLVLFAAAFLLATLWTRLRMPWLGPVQFTSRLGPKLFSIPLGYLLLWCIVLLGSRQLIRSTRPQAAHGQIAAGLALLAAVTALNLLPLVQNVSRRVFWFAPLTVSPLTTVVIWGLFAGLAGFYALRGTSQVTLRPTPGQPRAAMVFVTLNLLGLLGHLGRWLA